VADAARVAWVHDPDLAVRSFPRRPDSQLPFDPEQMPPDAPVMLDTNVYIAITRGGLPVDIGGFLKRRAILHCGIALAELTVSAGILDPGHPRTRAIRNPLRRALEAIDLSNCKSPSAAAWAEAGMLSGILARTQLGLASPRKGLSPAEACCQEGRRRKVLNDALIFLTAGEQGAILVSSNIIDMDLLSRFRPDIGMLLFRQIASVPASIG
jgi:predicted nucleic acid-binding protein